MIYLRLVNKLIITLLLTGCTTTNRQPSPCPKSHTLMCEIRGSREDCWCQDTTQMTKYIGEIYGR